MVKQLIECDILFVLCQDKGVKVTEKIKTISRRYKAIMSISENIRGIDFLSIFKKKKKCVFKSLTSAAQRQTPPRLLKHQWSLISMWEWNLGRRESSWMSWFWKKLTVRCETCPFAHVLIGSIISEWFWRRVDALVMKFAPSHWNCHSLFAWTFQGRPKKKKIILIHNMFKEHFCVSFLSGSMVLLKFTAKTTVSHTWVSSNVFSSSPPAGQLWC